MHRSSVAAFTVATVLGTAVVSGALVIRGADDSTAGLTVQAAAPAVSASESAPGLGRSARDVTRDDLLALGEAWQRGQRVAECMAAQGFDYLPEALYPGGAVLRVAAALGVSPDAQPAPSPEARNATYVTAMSPAASNRYFLALYDETAQAIDRADGEAGGGEALSESFADGGCSGEARQAIDSLWSLPDVMEQMRVELRRAERAKAEQQPAGVAWSACLAAQGLPGITGPAGIDELLLASFDPAVVSQATAACRPLEEATTTAVQQSVAAELERRFAGELAEQRSRYASAEQDLRADPAFATFVAQAAGRALIGGAAQ